MDSACAKAGSHDGMMEQAGLKTAKDCTEACVKGGNKYVLYNKTSKKVYQLDDQTKPQQFAGQNVTVKGTLDSARFHPRKQHSVTLRSKSFTRSP